MSITADASILTPKFEWNANWKSGKITTFASEITPPATAVRVGKTYRARVRHMDNTNRWSHWSEPTQFTVTEPDLSLWSNLVISEIMYNPSQPSISELNAIPELNNTDFEWLEIQNIGPISLDLEELRFTKGIEFNFSESATKKIAPGQKLLIVANEAAFNLRYGHPSTPQFVAGTFFKNLSDSGERIKLSFGAGTPVIDFNYDDDSPWPVAADGDGHSLVLIAPETNPDPNLANNWRISSQTKGNPGNSDVIHFEGNPNSDDNQNGLSNLVEYALIGKIIGNVITVQNQPYPSISYIRKLGSDDVYVSIETSQDLRKWNNSDSNYTILKEEYLGDGLIKITLRGINPIHENNLISFFRILITQR